MQPHSLFRPAVTCRRIHTLIALLGFLLLSFQWEVDQMLMWKTMIQTRSPELGWLKATDQALSGKAPCSKCVSLSREHVTDRDGEQIHPPNPPATAMVLARPLSLPPPFPPRLGLLQETGFPFKNRTLPAPTPPPV